MNLIDISYAPPVEVSPRCSVRNAVAAAEPVGCDAVVVVDGGKMRGILTSRDVLLKVVLQRRDPQSICVADVMTTHVELLHPDTDPEQALQIMLEHNFRHLPLSSDGVKVQGMLSLRKVLNFIVTDQRENLMHMEAFLNADGPGG